MTPGQKGEREIIIGELREARWQMCLKGLIVTCGLSMLESLPHPIHPSLQTCSPGGYPQCPWGRAEPGVAARCLIALHCRGNHLHDDKTKWLSSL